MHKTLRIHNAPLYTAAASVYPYSKHLETHFLVNTRFSEEPVFLAKKMGDALHIPRELAPVGIDDRRSDGSNVAIILKVLPRDDLQVALINQSVELLRQKEKSHTFQAVTGFGKSYCATNIITQVGVTTLIICTKEDLIIQWRKNLLAYTNLTEDDIGLVQQNICQYKGKKVCLGMVHSLASIEYPSDFYDYFGLIVADECHRMSADTFSQVMFKSNAKLRLGVTATPKRPDGKDFVFKAHIGEVLVKSESVLVPPKVLVIHSGWKLPQWKKRDPLTGGYISVPMPHKAGRMAGVVKSMGMDDARNHLIADLCLKAYNKDRKIVIFFEQIENHLRKIAPILIKMGVPAGDIKEYVGGLSEKERHTNAKARIILGSYSYFSEGTDIPDLDTAILASPRSNVTQAIGRILRKLEGKKEPVIFDIVDEHSAVLLNMFNSRVRQYKQLKANILTFS